MYCLLRGICWGGLLAQIVIKVLKLFLFLITHNSLFMPHSSYLDLSILNTNAQMPVIQFKDITLSKMNKDVFSNVFPNTMNK